MRIVLFGILVLVKVFKRHRFWQKAIKVSKMARYTVTLEPFTVGNFLSEPTVISSNVNDTSNVQIKKGTGYDHNFVLNKKAGLEVPQAAWVTGDISGITMEVFTQEPRIAILWQLLYAE